jgi:hypothetical protein
VTVGGGGLGGFLSAEILEEEEKICSARVGRKGFVPLVSCNLGGGELGGIVVEGES